MSRRKRYSEQTAQEIKDIARRLMAEKGTAGLSIRAIAREIEMTPPAIYTYFPSLDDLITALIVDAFNAYADALEVARDAAAERGESLGEQLIAITHEYRNWALAYPAQFQLIYGSPIPGYHAPRDLTVPAVTRTGQVFIGLMRAMWEAGEAPLPDVGTDYPPTVLEHLREFAGEDAPDFAVHGVYQMYSMWVALHGMVTLEVFNHLQGTVGDTDAFFTQQVNEMFGQLGVMA
jgi:AcrR family transcriptional regulator